MVFQHSDPETASASGRPKATAYQKGVKFSRERLACPLALAFAKHLLPGSTRKEFRYLIPSWSLNISLASLEKFIVHALSLPISPWSEIITKKHQTKNLCFCKQVFYIKTTCWVCADLLRQRKLKNCSLSYLSQPWANGGKSLITNTTEAYHQ